MKTKMKSKLFAMLLSLTMVVAVMPSQAFAGTSYKFGIVLRGEGSGNVSVYKEDGSGAWTLVDEGESIPSDVRLKIKATPDKYSDIDNNNVAITTADLTGTNFPAGEKSIPTPLIFSEDENRQIIPGEFIYDPSRLSQEYDAWKNCDKAIVISFKNINTDTKSIESQKTGEGQLSCYLLNGWKMTPARRAREGDTIVVSAEPQSGWTLSGLYLLEKGADAPSAPYEITSAFRTFAYNDEMYQVAMPYYDAKVYAVFTSGDTPGEKHTVTFYDEDETTVLQTGDWEEGSTPVYSGQTPTKAADAQYTYTFAGWNPAITEVTGNATYKATYTATPVQGINFVMQNSYTFPAVQVGYTSVDKKGIGLQNKGSDTITVTISGNSNPDYFNAYFSGQKSSITIDANSNDFVYVERKLGLSQNDYSGTITVTATTSSGQTDTKTLTLSQKVNPAASQKYTVTFYDEDETTVLQTGDWEEGSTPVYSGQTPTKPADAQNTYTFAGWNPEITEVTGDATYTATYTATLIPVTTYTVTVINDGNGTGTANPTSGTQGTQVTLSASPNSGYKFKEWQVVSGGVTVTNDKFTIGTADVVVKATFELIPPDDISTAIVIASDQTYDGTEKKPVPIVTWNGKTLTEGTDYDVTAYADNIDAGEATVTVTGKGKFAGTAKGTFTITEKPVYEAVSGSGGTYTKGPGKTLAFTYKRSADDGTTFSHFKGITVDGKAVPEKDASGKANWTAKSGSVIIELQSSYLETLSVGEHKLAVQFDDGADATSTFTVKAKPATPTVTPTKAATTAGKATTTAPKTGDASNMLLWFILICASLFVMFQIISLRNRRFYDR